MKSYKCVLSLIILTLIFRTGLAQNGNNMSVTDRSSVSIDMNALIAAGVHSEKIVDNTQWINYSLFVSPSEPLSSISVELSSGNIPKGMELYIQAGYNTGSGRGKLGRPTGKIRVDNVPKVLISDIGTSFTGNGKHQGHRLILSMVITDFSLLQPGDYTIYILYTLKQ
ncbi:MAG: hypothetical protein ACD_77C00500G0002 [uncultured bacterium]|nr:MAG: hypothetical protein ACD_77C00500G0002 [uncultured bacterium]